MKIDPVLLGELDRLARIFGDAVEQLAPKAHTDPITIKCLEGKIFAIVPTDADAAKADAVAWAIMNAHRIANNVAATLERLAVEQEAIAEFAAKVNRHHILGYEAVNDDHDRRSFNAPCRCAGAGR